MFDFWGKGNYYKDKRKRKVTWVPWWEWEFFWLRKDFISIPPSMTFSNLPYILKYILRALPPHLLVLYLCDRTLQQGERQDAGSGVGGWAVIGARAAWRAGLQWWDGGTKKQERMSICSDPIKGSKSPLRPITSSAPHRPFEGSCLAPPSATWADMLAAHPSAHSWLAG